MKAVTADTDVNAAVVVAETVSLLSMGVAQGDMSDSDPKPEQSDLTIGDWVYDQDDTDADPDIAVVVNTPSVPAHDWEVPVPDSKTLAEDNPKYPEDAPTVVVVYRDELREARSEWRERTKPYPLGELAADGISFYAFPAGRLTPTSNGSDNANTADDNDIDT